MTNEITDTHLIWSLQATELVNLLGIGVTTLDDITKSIDLNGV